MLARTLMLGAAIMALAGCGFTGNFRNDLGYADFGSLQRLEADSDLRISLGPLPLQVAKWALHDDEDVGPFVRELRAVRVYTFEGIANADDVAAGVDELTAELARDGWLRIAAINEGAEHTSVFLRPDEDFRHHGLAVVIEEPDEVVLVNLIGNIRLDFINGYLADLDVDVPRIEIDPAALSAAALDHPSSKPGSRNRSVTP